MRPSTLLALFLVCVSPLSAQVPAPDFDVYASLFTSVNWNLNFHVQGPPSSPVAVLITFDDPFSTPPEQIIIYPFLNGSTDNQGQFSATFSVPSWQGPLPDVWFGAIVTPQGQPAVLAGVVDVAAMNGGPTTVACNPSQHKMALLAGRNPAGQSPVGRIGAQGRVCPGNLVAVQVVLPGGASAMQPVPVAPDGSFQWLMNAAPQGTSGSLLVNGQPNGLETVVVP